MAFWDTVVIKATKKKKKMYYEERKREHSRKFRKKIFLSNLVCFIFLIVHVMGNLPL